MDTVPGPESTATQPPSLANLEAFKQLFPGVIQDGVLDAARLGDSLGIDVAGIKGGKESFGLAWAGKHRAVEALQAPSYAALVPDTGNSVNWDTAENVFIEGDNLEVLKLLQNAYNDQVKLIYIDPPYNTGNDFVYNDDFSDPIKHYLEVTGQVAADGNRLVANTEVSGRKHSNWLTMMYPRLSLARNLLSQDGSIFVSIDDNEVSHLRSLMDEIFGPENFLGQLVWAAGRKNDAKFISASHEYVLVYARNFATLNAEVGQWRARKSGLDAIHKQVSRIRLKYPTDFLAATAEIKNWFKQLPDGDDSKRHKQYSVIDGRGLYFPDNISWPGGGGPRYEVLHPVTGQPVKIPSTGWRFTEDKLNQMVSQNRIHFGQGETTVPCVKRYLEDSEFEVPYSVFYTDGRGATKRLRELLGGDYFDFPKDEQVLANFIEFATNRDGIILDFFAGSGTIGHAVMLQNQNDGGSRKYILVTIDEPTDPKSFSRSKGVDKVSDITVKRLKAMHQRFPGTGFKSLKLERSAFNVQLVNSNELDLKENSVEIARAPLELSQELFLSLGVRIDQPIVQKINEGNEILMAGGVMLCLSSAPTANLVEFAIDNSCHVLVVLEDNLAGKDDLKANLFFGCKKANITFKTF